MTLPPLQYCSFDEISIIINNWKSGACIKDKKGNYHNIKDIAKFPTLISVQARERAIVERLREIQRKLHETQTPKTSLIALGVWNLERELEGGK